MERVKFKMKYSVITVISLFIICSCNQTTKTVENEQLSNDIIRSDFAQILDSAELIGSVLIYDPDEKKYYSNDFEYAKIGTLPASTFKITNTIIGLETGILPDTNYVFKWKGEKRRMAIWEQDLNLQQAFSKSCVPCYQELARSVGTTQMQNKLKALNYGNMVVTDSSLDKFWLEGPSKISLFEQINFLERFYTHQLPISEKTYNTMQHIMLLKHQPTYELYGKTGWCIRDQQNIGWFVGYVKKQESMYYFATRVEPKENFPMENFPQARVEITQKALQSLRILP